MLGTAKSTRKIRIIEVADGSWGESGPAPISQNQCLESELVAQGVDREPRASMRPRDERREAGDNRVVGTYLF